MKQIRQRLSMIRRQQWNFPSIGMLLLRSKIHPHLRGRRRAPLTLTYPKFSTPHRHLSSARASDPPIRFNLIVTLDHNQLQAWIRRNSVSGFAEPPGSKI
jgi:hypothetical protein